MNYLYRVSEIERILGEMEPVSSHIGELIGYDRYKEIEKYGNPRLGDIQNVIVIFDETENGDEEISFERKFSYQHLNSLGMGELGDFMRMDVYQVGPFMLEHLSYLEEALFIEAKPKKRKMLLLEVLDGGRK